MDIEELKEHALKLSQKAHNMGVGGPPHPSEITGLYSQAMEFLSVYGGPQNFFMKTLEDHNYVKASSSVTLTVIHSTMSSFLEHIEEGLYTGISPERRAQIDTVSDFLEMADQLLNTKSVHPAASAVLIGASLEEFLRTWMDAEGLELGSKKRGLQNYALVLREADFLNSQDTKDITSWGGIRNEAAHGEWEKISKERVSLMLQGINLFMREYSPLRQQ